MLEQTFKLPFGEVKTSKSGFEIRTEVLGLAHKAVFDRHAWEKNQWEIKLVHNPNLPAPQIPSYSDVLETARQYMEFVNYKGPPTQNKKR